MEKTFLRGLKLVNLFLIRNETKNSSKFLPIFLISREEASKVCLVNQNNKKEGKPIHLCYLKKMAKNILFSLFSMIKGMYLLSLVQEKEIINFRKEASKCFLKQFGGSTTKIKNTYI